jgi:hypothetical protein
VTAPALRKDENDNMGQRLRNGRAGIGDARRRS